MFEWLTVTTRDARFKSNLNVIETALSGASMDCRAKIVLKAMDFIEGLRRHEDGPDAGIALQEVALSVLGPSEGVALHLYDLLESVMNARAKEYKQKQREWRLGKDVDFVKYLEQENAIQEMALRLLMVAAARKVSPEFAVRTSGVGEMLCKAKDSLAAAINVIKDEQNTARADRPEARLSDPELLILSAQNFLMLTEMSW